MKRVLCLFLAATLCFCFFGCKPETGKTKDPVNFYYRRSKLTYDSEDSVIAPMEAEAAGHRDDPAYLLNQYFSGPEGETFDQTFPTGTALLELVLSEARAEVILSPQFAQLSDIDLTVACGCIAKTVMELTGVSSVKIIAEGEALDGSPYITMDADNMLLQDIYVPETTK